MNNNLRDDWRGYLTSSFYDKLIKGSWKPLMELIANDPELDVQIRNNYLNIYYKGGSLIKLKNSGPTFDRNYFYNKTLPEYSESFPISYIEKVANCKELPMRAKKERIPSFTVAKNIDTKLNDKLSNLKNYFQNGEYENFLNLAKKTMDDWDIERKAERKDQHYIAIANKTFSPDNNIIVVDLEFELSKKKSHHKYNNTGKNPIFDIIGIDDKGQLYVIELKENMKADGPNKKANVEDHLADFEKSIGQDLDRDFNSEIEQLIRVKNELGLLSLKDIKVLRNKPIFAISYSGEKEDEFYSSHPEILPIKVKNNKLVK